MTLFVDKFNIGAPKELIFISLYIEIPYPSPSVINPYDTEASPLFLYCKTYIDSSL